MFRLTEMHERTHHADPCRAAPQSPGPVVIWNLIRRCNLKCKHCYSISGDVDFPAS